MPPKRKRERLQPRGLPENPLFTLPEAARSRSSPVSGAISADTLYDLAARGELPGVFRVGNKIYVTRSGLAELLARGGYRASRS